MAFHLPPDISFQKERHPYGWAYIFRHTQLGQIGRIILQGRPDGQTQATCEVLGDPDDPMTEKRAAIFKPLGTEMVRELQRALGGGMSEEDPWATPPPSPPAPKHKIAGKLMQCKKCGANVAFLIFAERGETQGDLEDYARLMYPEIVRHQVPTWIIGPMSGAADTMRNPATILKVWPYREPVFRASPEEFNSVVETLEAGHCG